MALAPTPQVVQQYNELQQQMQQIASKIAELEIDRNEHLLVEETLKPLDGARRAYRLVGEVLVERSIQEVLPSVEHNRKNLEETVASLRNMLQEKQKLTAELKSKYNLQTQR